MAQDYGFLGALGGLGQATQQTGQDMQKQFAVSQQLGAKAKSAESRRSFHPAMTRLSGMVMNPDEATPEALAEIEQAMQGAPDDLMQAYTGIVGNIAGAQSKGDQLAAEERARAEDQRLRQLAIDMKAEQDAETNQLNRDRFDLEESRVGAAIGASEASAAASRAQKDFAEKRLDPTLAPYYRIVTDITMGLSATDQLNLTKLMYEDKPAFIAEVERRVNEKTIAPGYKILTDAYKGTMIENSPLAKIADATARFNALKDKRYKTKKELDLFNALPVFIADIQAQAQPAPPVTPASAPATTPTPAGITPELIGASAVSPVATPADTISISGSFGEPMEIFGEPIMMTKKEQDFVSTRMPYAFTDTAESRKKAETDLSRFMDNGLPEARIIAEALKFTITTPLTPIGFTPATTVPVSPDTTVASGAPPSYSRTPLAGGEALASQPAPVDTTGAGVAPPVQPAPADTLGSDIPPFTATPDTTGTSAAPPLSQMEQAYVQSLIEAWGESASRNSTSVGDFIIREIDKIINSGGQPEIEALRAKLMGGEIPQVPANYTDLLPNRLSRNEEFGMRGRR